MIPSLLNPEIFSEQNRARLSQQFNTNKPIRHIVIDNFLSNEFATALSKNFPTLAEMKTHYHGFNENKAEDCNFDKLAIEFSQLHGALSDPSFINWIESWSGIKGFSIIDDRLGYGLHQGGNQSFLDIHIDYNIHPIKKLYRKLNLILFFNPIWEDDWGGNLELWDSQVKNCIQSISPVFNRCVCFECSDISYHGYNKINVPKNITRKSYYQYYFTPLKEGITYRDTFFKARPDQAVLKKTLTPLKENAKNFAKKILLRLGMEKILK